MKNFLLFSLSMLLSLGLSAQIDEALLGHFKDFSGSLEAEQLEKSCSQSAQALPASEVAKLGLGYIPAGTHYFPLGKIALKKGWVLLYASKKEAGKMITVDAVSFKKKGAKVERLSYLLQVGEDFGQKLEGRLSYKNELLRFEQESVDSKTGKRSVKTSIYQKDKNRLDFKERF